ncbi:MAG: DegT/DnrJ/EryC1/StrS family aminotransferase [Desulfobacteraceae bacterium]|nr:DegT/DnrJ/EryC1/StrS family aminotransferase [Desulfobacteraceae bacterium]
MNVPLLDLKAQYKSLREEIRLVLDEVCDSQYFILGPRVEQMEEQLAKYCAVPHAVGVSSGTDALLGALMAAGVGNGDNVLTSPYSFFATAGAIARVGAKPVFVDIDKRTYNLDPGELRRVIEKMDGAERENTKAIIPIHLYGQCADMEPILAIAKHHNLVVVEDAAQAIGSEYKGRRAGSIGDFGCFSFFPSKNLGAFGDAGLITTNSPENYKMLVKIRMHGMEPKYYHQYIGGNFRVDALQAAVISVKLKYLDSWTKKRQHNGATYRRLFSEAGLEQWLQLPAEIEDRHIYNQFVIRVFQDRDKLKEHLLANGIGCEIYYPVPLHLQKCFSYLGYQEGDFPVSEDASRQTLAIPIYPELSQDQLCCVVEQIEKFFKRK